MPWLAMHAPHYQGMHAPTHYGSALARPLAGDPPVTESEGQFERFVHLFASAISIVELVANRRAIKSPVFWGSAVIALAIMWRKA